MMMPGPAHHQGSHSLPEYQEVWVREFTSLFFVTQNFACLLIILLFSSQSASHEGQPCNEFMAYAMAHKGKATSDVSFSQTDPPEAYSNPSVHTRIMTTPRWERRSTGTHGIRLLRPFLEKPS